VDEQQRSRIRDDLQGFFQGDLLFDDVTRMLYSTDASIFQVKPIGVAAPRDEDDLRTLVRYAYENKIPLIARGAGTGLLRSRRPRPSPRDCLTGFRSA